MVKETVSKVCLNCGQYNRKTKKCADIKFVPRKGICSSWIPLKDENLPSRVIK